jgi:uncharacterized repeat protein (TIGR03843 family)
MASVDAHPLELLRQGKITVEGEFLWGSNYTFLVKVNLKDETRTAVYKPSRGERPLWDFPTASLARREAAAYLVSQALGWELVPPTVYRSKAPIGPGSLQLYVEHDPEYHYFNFSEADRQRLRPVALFDVLINNADRKGSHILLDPDQHLWLIDHGVCFHVEDKLRTVIWDFVGEPIPQQFCADLTSFIAKLTLEGESTNFIESLRPLLSEAEIRALGKRASRLITNPTFPAPDPYRRPYPWPQI